MSESLTGTPTSRSAQHLTTHHFNDDLLLDGRVRELLREELSNVFPLLDDPELRGVFEPIDNQACWAKRRSERAGAVAVLFAALALISAASEPVWNRLPGVLPATLAVSAGLLGILAVLIAYVGVLYGPRKQEWLQKRFFTERLRQLHFQAFIWQLSPLSQVLHNPGPSTLIAFRKLRERRLSAFLARYERRLDAELKAVLDPNVVPDMWLYERPTNGWPSPPPGVDLTEVFRAYRLLRFNEQIGYANHKVGPGGWSFNFWKLGLRARQRVLQGVWTVAFVGLVVGEALAVIGYLRGTHTAHSGWVHMVVLWLAITALAARTFAEGLALSREIERYEDYRAIVSDLRNRFDRADRAEEKFEAMVEMERVSFEEMRSFLRTNNEAQFIL